jgi:hypothetical protein
MEKQGRRCKKRFKEPKVEVQKEKKSGKGESCLRIMGRFSGMRCRRRRKTGGFCILHAAS